MSDDPLRRLAAGCLLPGFVGLEPPGWLLRALDGGLGGVTLFARNVAGPDQVAALSARIHQARPDALIAIDEEGGDVTRLEAATGSSYPGSLALGTAGDPALTEAVAAALGADLARAGVDLDLAPVADVNSNPQNPVIGVRSFGAEAGAVAGHVGAFVAGLQSRGVAACAKHFPGHGDTSVDSHLALPVVGGSEEALEAALLPFRAAIAAGVRAIMTAHLVVPALDRQPATLSRPILTGLLRGRLGFDGLVVTDGLEMGAIVATAGLHEAAVLAVAAGADAICVGGGLAGEEIVDELAGALAVAVSDGHLDAERLEEAAARVAATARWAADGRAAPQGPAPDRSVGLEAARRAVSATGLPAAGIGAAPVVAELRPPPGIAAGVVPWGLGDVLAARDRGVTVLRLDGEDGAAAVLAAAEGRPLILVARDLHRHPEHEAAADAVVRRRSDAIVVEMGLPGCPPAGVAFVRTFGAGRVNALAAADLLMGDGSR